MVCGVAVKFRFFAAAKEKCHIMTVFDNKLSLLNARRRKAAATSFIVTTFKQRRGIEA